VRYLGSVQLISPRCRFTGFRSRNVCCWAYADPRQREISASPLAICRKFLIPIRLTDTATREWPGTLTIAAGELAYASGRRFSSGLRRSQ
jgi:hypothetical protein